MAEEIEVIKQRMLDLQATLPALANATSNSQVAIFGNIYYVTAVEISVLEQLIDDYIAQIETIINNQAIGSTPWLRAKILEFQYPDSVQLDLNNFEISYPVINPVLQIITRCSVDTIGNLIVLVKVAKSDPPEALVSDEIAALNNYINIIQPDGTQINVISLDPDRLFIDATVIASGQFSGSIPTNIPNALNAFMANLSDEENFDGLIRVSSLVDAIKAVPGVIDFKINELSVRASTVVFASRTIIYNLASGINLLAQPTTSGYLVAEDTSGQTFSDKVLYQYQ